MTGMCREREYQLEESHALEKEDPPRAECLATICSLKHIVKVQTLIKRIDLSLSETIFASVKPVTSSHLQQGKEKTT